MLSTQSRKKGLGHVPVVKLIQKESLFLRSSSVSPSSLSSLSSPSPRGKGKMSSRMEEQMPNMASTSEDKVLGSPATPSNLNMLTREVRRNSCTAARNLAAYFGPARERPCSVTSNPCFFANRTRSSLAWPYPPQGDNHTLNPAPICFALSATATKPLGNLLRSNVHKA